MKAAFIIYDNMTALDFIGIYDPLTRLSSMNIMPDFTWDVCALSNCISDHNGLQFTASSVAPDLAQYDMIVVPGAYDVTALEHDTAFIKWLKSAKAVKLKTSVCTGSVLLGAAGFLDGLKATTHPAYFSGLEPYCKEVANKRIVDEGDVVTAQGVTSAIDLGLYLVEKITGIDARKQIAKQMDYPYYKQSV